MFSKSFTSFWMGDVDLKLLEILNFEEGSSLSCRNRKYHTVFIIFVKLGEGWGFVNLRQDVLVSS